MYFWGPSLSALRQSALAFASSDGSTSSYTIVSSHFQQVKNGVMHLSIRVDCSGKGICQPVHRYRGQNLIKRRRCISPCEKLLPNPVEPCEQVATTIHRLLPYQARSANGLDDSVNPIVAGRVECSRAYAVPNLPNSSARRSPSSSKSSTSSVP